MKRKKHGKGIRKKLVAAAIGMMAVLLTGCLDDYEEDGYGTGESADYSRTEFSGTRSSISMNLSDDGSLQIQRLKRENPVPMGDPGTWTIFVYMCGTDLESENGLASMDLQEMVNASTGTNVRYVVQTGGTQAWDNDYTDTAVFERYEISAGEITQVGEQELISMGDSSALADFLKWGVTTYPAEKMGVILWNHGGGSITGICFDEMYDYDSLSLRELDAALLSVYDSMTDNFEFIGFDACLMSTIECANVLASYADYMYGSEETEPGYGWDYKEIGDYLGAHPEADGAQLGEVVADSFYDACEEIGEEDMVTFSITALSQIDPLLGSFHTYAENLYAASEDSSVFSEIVRSVWSADNYGGNNKSEGYTNMVDLAGIIRAGADYADGAQEVLDLLDQTIVYKKNGWDHEAACGLSTYYPLEIQGSSELSTFGQIAVSPYYLAFVDRAAYGAVNGGDTSAYNESETLDGWGFFDYLFSDTSDDYYTTDGESDYWSYYDEYEVTGESSLITFEQEPMIDENGSYGFVLDADSLDYTASVQACVYMLSADGADLIDLGQNAYINMDWQTGTFSDAFDGYWYSLPDGQNLAVYIVSENDGYDIYTSPVMVNGEETNLRITHDYENGIITIDGTWDGIDENGMAAKEIRELQAGDEIVPLYDAIAVDSDDEYQYIGEAYIFDGEPEITFEALTDGEYYYGFIINDVYGDYYVTDFVEFDVEGDEIYYYTE